MATSRSRGHVARCNPAENTPLRVDGEASDGDDGDDDDPLISVDDMYAVAVLLAKPCSAWGSSPSRS